MKKNKSDSLEMLTPSHNLVPVMAYIERTIREDVEQLESVDFILENSSYIHYPLEPVIENIMSINELYDIYSRTDDPELNAYPRYKMSDLIDLLTSEGYDIRESSAHNGNLCIFWES